MKIMEKIKKGLQTWLNINPYLPRSISIQAYEDFELSSIKNRIWFRGDPNELLQLYSQLDQPADEYKFWACKSSPGMGLRKIHTGLPALMIRVLSSIIMRDMNGIEIESGQQEDIWKEIEKENGFMKSLKTSIEEALYIGDGAWKISIDTEISEYPFLEWIPGDRVDFDYCHGRLKEVIFKKPKKINGQKYTLYEHYGHGYIEYELRSITGDEVEISRLLPDMKNWMFDSECMLAIPFKIFESSKYKNRGGSVFSPKLDAFDSFDEIWSLWMDAARAGRVREYIPENKLPRDREGHMLMPNAFDNRYIKMDSDMSEHADNKIEVVQPEIRSDAFLQAYMTALDQCLQGIISPSTLGIDVKKLDNAEAQREKEKTTLYTRNAIIEALQQTLPDVIRETIHAFYLLHGMPLEEVNASIPFGEYANPSFESQVETIGKAKTQGIMSVEACVDELYGDTKPEEWKAEEVARLKAEQNFTAGVTEPAANLDYFADSSMLDFSNLDLGLSGDPPAPIPATEMPPATEPAAGAGAGAPEPGSKGG